MISFAGKTMGRGFPAWRGLWLLALGAALFIPSQRAAARDVDIQISDARVVISDADELVFGADLRAPRFCPYDSNWVCFEARKGQSVRLMLYNQADAKLTEINPGNGQSSARPGGGGGAAANVKSMDFDWRPVAGPGNGRWFVFSSDAAGGSLDLWLGDARTGETVHLQNRHSGKAETGAKWSPDGEVIAYCSDATGAGDIYLIPFIKEMFADSSRDLSSEHKRIVADPGLDYEIRWYPGPMAGYFVYTHQDPPEQAARRVEMRICDAVNEVNYPLKDSETNIYLRSASWNPTGRGELAFYQTDEFPEPGKEVLWYVGMAKVELDPKLGAINFHLNRPGNQQWFERGVRPSEDLKIGPVWSPDGRYMALTRVIEEEQNPAWLYDISDWEFGLRHRSDKSFAPEYKFPHDLTITGNQIAFTYIDGPNTRLLTGTLGGSNLSVPPPPATWPLLTPARGQGFYDKYIKRPSFFQKVGRWATRPVAGPNFGINSNIIFWPGAIAAVAVLAGGGGGKTVITGETWNPPGFGN